MRNSPLNFLRLALRFLICLAALGQGTRTQAQTETYSWKSVRIGGGGFVTGVVFHPNVQNLFYCRTDVGGAYRWDEAGQTWIPLNDDIGGLNNEFMLLGVVSLAVDPNNSQALYLACGQYLADWAPNGAIFRSYNRGQTWSRVNLSFKLGGNSDGRSAGERLQVDPNAGNILFLGTNQDGLWKSTSGGASWTRVATFPAASVNFVQFKKSSGTGGTATPVLYAGVNATSGPALYQSSDGGANWSALPGQPTGLLAYQAALSSTGMLFVTYMDKSGPSGVTAGAVWRLNTQTGEWKNVSPPAGQGGFAGVSVSATNPQQVVVSTLNRWWPGDEIYRSTNGGDGWTAILRPGTKDTSSAPWAGAMNIHWTGDVDVDPFNPARVLFPTGYGLFATTQATNIDASTIRWAFFNNGLEETVPQSLVCPPSGAPLVSVIKDFDGYRHDNLSVSPATRHSPSFGSSRGLDFAENAPHLFVRAGGSQGAYSLNGASTWTVFPTKPANATNGGTIAISADGATIVWSPDGAAISRSLDRGQNWTAATGGIPGALRPVSDRVNSSKFYAVETASRRLWVSTNAGASFSVAATNLPASLGTLKAVPGLEGQLWLPANDSGLYRSINSGAAFSAVSGVQRAYSVGFGKSADDQSHPAVYLWGQVNSVTGFFRSVDGGSTWLRINDDKHQFGRIEDIAGDAQIFGRVYFGTSGRGIVYGESSAANSAESSVPAGWTAQDIGSPSPAGSSTAEANTWTVRSGGADIWGAADQFHYAFQEGNGDLSIVARITSLPNTNAWAKAGVMIRESTAAGSRHATVVLTPGNGVAFQWRNNTGGSSSSTNIPGLSAPLWVRLERTGSSLRASYSANGTSWTTLGNTQTISMGSDAKAGLCVTSHANGTLNTSTFASVQILPAPDVAALKVNDGAAQRSMVRELSVTFTTPVTLESGAFVLIRRADGAAATLALSNPSGDGLTWILSPGGAAMQGTSLGDGIYDLTVTANKVRNTAGQAMSNGRTLTFHRLFGDSDGDKDSDSVDALEFRKAQGAISTSPNYRWYFDYDTDQDVDSGDSTAQRARKGIIYSY